MDSDDHCFSHFSRDDILKIAEHGLTRLYSGQSIIIYEGDDSDALYVILEGKVKVFVSDDTGKEIILNIQGPLEYFGELSLIDRAPRSASVMTMERTRVAYLSRSSFEQCLAENPSLALKLLSSMVQRVRSLTSVVKGLALREVHGRVVHTLMKLARAQDGKLIIEQRLTHRDIADMVGASREMVSRVMRDLTAAGYIVTDRRFIKALLSQTQKGVLDSELTTNSDPRWKYVKLRRYLAYLERSIQTGTQWAVFEPNDASLWAGVRESIERLLIHEWRSGRLPGRRSKDAFFVRCDSSTMTQDDLDHGRMVCLVGVAPVRPTEFVVFRVIRFVDAGRGRRVRRARALLSARHLAVSLQNSRRIASGCVLRIACSIQSPKES